ncbi:MAG: DNA-formamidopyrimidine glycosylase [Lactobacillus sp.]|nr:DNA-formamidopyrimidine glycosylase [Lactobacillus sp.]
MPELPEVETVRRTLLPLVKGKKIIEVNIWYPNLINGDAKAFKEAVTGKVIEDINRTGKFLEFRLSGQLTIVSHLRMEGKYRLVQLPFEKTKHDHVEYIFEDQTALIYNDVRKFGRLELVQTGQEATTGIGKLGFDAMCEFPKKAFYEKLHQKHKNIKTALLDQTVVSGLGNIYVDEVLFLTKIHPLSLASKLPQDKVDELHDQIIKLLSRAIELGGTTVHSYLNAAGKMGQFQKELLVYGKKDQPCPVCGHALDKIKVNGRGTTFCANCQKEYK